MRATILAARTERAMERIAAETARLGGEFVRPVVKGDAEHRQVILLEAIAEALAAITSSSEEAGKQSAGPVEVEPVEAIVSVVKEPAAKRSGKR